MNPRRTGAGGRRSCRRSRRSRSWRCSSLPGCGSATAWNRSSRCARRSMRRRAARRCAFPQPSDWDAWRYPAGASPTGTFDAAHQILLDNRMRGRTRRLHVVDAARARRRPCRARRARLGRRGRHARRRCRCRAARRGVVTVHRPHQPAAGARTSSSPATRTRGRVWQNLDLARYARRRPVSRCFRSSSSRRRRSTAAIRLVRDWPAPDRGRGEAPHLHAAVVRVRGDWRRDCGCSSRRAANRDRKRDRSASPATARRGRRTLMLIALVAVAPVVASYAAYYFFPRDKQRQLRRAPADRAPDSRDRRRQPFRLRTCADKWVLAVAAPGGCDAHVRRRAVRDAPGAHASRAAKWAASRACGSSPTTRRRLRRCWRSIRTRRGALQATPVRRLAGGRRPHLPRRSAGQPRARVSARSGHQGAGRRPRRGCSRLRASADASGGVKYRVSRIAPFALTSLPRSP